LGPVSHRKLSFSLATILGITGAMKVLFYMDSFKGPLFDLLRDNLWEGWAVWAFLLFLLGLEHPPVLVWEPLQGTRKTIGWLALFVFILTFTPVPFRVV
ncbi:MAG: site-2 protease family protein, partial [Nitrospirae bacterium]